MPLSGAQWSGHRRVLQRLSKSGGRGKVTHFEPAADLEASGYIVRAPDHPWYRLSQKGRAALKGTRTTKLRTVVDVKKQSAALNAALRRDR